MMNVGVYRGMVADRTHIPILMWRAQHIGHHVTAWQNGGAREMPIAVAIGWEPSLEFFAGAPVPKGVCEYDVMGAIRGAPVELVKCETVDLYVPATAEIVIEGYLAVRPRELHAGRAVRRVHRLSRRRPLRRSRPIRVTAITHRNDPILRGTIEGALPGSYSENAVTLLDHARGDRLERARPRRRAGDHRRVVPAGAGRHQSPDPDEAELSQPGEAGGQCDLGLLGRACALQAHHRGRRRHRHPRLRRGRLGDRLSRQCGRGRHRHHAVDLRRSASILRRASATAIPPCSAPASGTGC